MSKKAVTSLNVNETKSFTSRNTGKKTGVYPKSGTVSPTFQESIDYDYGAARKQNPVVTAATIQQF